MWQEKKKKVETGLLSADPSHDRLGHNFLPGHLRTNLNQQKPEVNHCCSDLEKERVLSLLHVATRELSDGQVHLGYGFNSIWTKNFQKNKLGFEEEKEPEIKLPTFTGSWRKQGNSRKISIFTSLTSWKPLIMWITTNWKILKEMGVPDHLTCCPRNLYACRSRSNS